MLSVLRLVGVFLAIFVAAPLSGGLEFLGPTHVKFVGPIFGPSLEYVIHHRAVIGALSALFLLVVGLDAGVLSPRMQARATRRRILDTMLGRVFGGSHDIRATLFTPCGWLGNTWINLRELLSFVLHRARLTRTPVPWRRQKFHWGSYIKARERVGGMFTKKRPYFYLDPGRAKYSEGVAGVAWSSGERIILDDLPELEELRGVNPKNRVVRRYMVAAHIRDSSRLYRMNARARHFYADRVTNASGEPIGVLVIDSSRDRTFTDDTTLDRLGAFFAVLSSTFP